jgi:NAD(P)-dependent dehydrogenase (short-subunit alcohol dehydrogenase family)
MTKTTEQQSVLVTGCSSGFGKAAALVFLKSGWKVTATMRSISEW